MLAGATVAVAGLMFCALFEAANSRIYLRMSEKGAGALPAISEQRSLFPHVRRCPAERESRACDDRS